MLSRETNSEVQVSLFWLLGFNGKERNRFDKDDAFINLGIQTGVSGSKL